MNIFNRLIGRRHLSRALLGATTIAAAFEPGKASAAHPHDSEGGTPRRESPLDRMSEFLNGFHFYADDIGRQVEANHYCTHLSEDFHQCVIYDSNAAKPHLIGIEYIVSARVFGTLPDDEKRLWHSHHYEVKSGELVAPDLPEAAEHAFMTDLATTYGKTWHCWQIDRDPSFPFGIPQLMMGFTQDGQINAQIVRDRDRRFEISSLERRLARTDILVPAVKDGANSWQTTGRTLQLRLEEVAVRNLKM